jgi:ATP-dependent Clp protease protease subunit
MNTLPQQPDIFYINYFDIINESKVKGLMAICNDIIAKVKPRELYFLFSSNGGSVDAGITLYNFLRSLPVDISMHNMGSIDSIATVIFLAGNKRYASPHSAFLFHGVQFNFEGKISVNNQQLIELLSRLKTDQQKISGVLTDRTKLTADEVKDLFIQGESKDPQFAVSKGIINNIVAASIPPNAPCITVNIN